MRETNEKIFGVYYETQFNMSAIEIGKLICIRDAKGTIKTYKDREGNFNAFVKDNAINFLDLMIVEVSGRMYVKRVSISHMDAGEFELDKKYLNEVQTYLLDSDVFRVGKALEFENEGKVTQGIVNVYNGDVANVVVPNEQEPSKPMTLKINSKDLIDGRIKIIKELI